MAIPKREYREYRDEHVPNNVFAKSLSGFTPLKKADDTEGNEQASESTVAPQAPASLVVIPILKKGNKSFDVEATVALANVTKAAQQQQAKQANERPPMKAQLRATRVDAPTPVEQSKKEWKGNIPVWELFDCDQSVLFGHIGSLLQAKETPEFAFFFEEDEGFSALAMSVTIHGESVNLKATRAEGKLSKRFPKGFTLSVEELRGAVLVYDPNHLQKVNEFRRVMDLLRSQLHSSLSRKLSEALRKSGR